MARIFVGVTAPGAALCALAISLLAPDCVAAQLAAGRAADNVCSGLAEAFAADSCIDPETPILFANFAALACQTGSKCPETLVTPLAKEAAMARIAQADPPNTDGPDCSSRLRTFIAELDRTLDGKPPSIEPVLLLLKTHFPLEHCDIPTALQISRSSRYFVEISESPHLYVILFDSNKFSKHFGIRIQFGLLKTSGNSSSPSAIVKQ